MLKFIPLYFSDFRYLRDLKYVDRDRIAVWGWSYGGFATAMILAQDEKVFHCGISVAPITSWTHYGESWLLIFTP
jgi:dipeptidyl-peptidase-4